MQTVFVSVETDVMGTFAVSVQIELLVLVVTIVCWPVPTLVLYEVPTELQKCENGCMHRNRELNLRGRDCLDLGVGLGVGLYFRTNDGGNRGVSLRRKTGCEGCDSLEHD